MKKRIILLIAIVFIMGGCIKFKGAGIDTSIAGGVYKSFDAGKTWAQKVALPTATGVQNIGNRNVLKIEIDPSDRNAVYIGTREHGLLYSYDGGESWRNIAHFNNQKVLDVAVSYFDKCTIYATLSNKLWRSTDCGRTWKDVYTDTREGVYVAAITADSYAQNQNVIYMGTSAGDILKSTDRGEHWANLYQIEKGAVKRIVLDRKDTRNVYAVSLGKGMFKSADAGSTWNEVSLDTKQFKGADDIRDMKQVLTAGNTFIIATYYGLLKTNDGGATWEEIKLNTPEREAQIYALAVDPKNGNNIYYGTDTTFYRSADGGATWQSASMPAPRAASYLLIDPQDSNMIYLGTLQLK